MKHNGGFKHGDWDNAPLRHGDEHGPGSENEPPAAEVLVRLALQTGLWAAGCLAIATTAPAVLMAPLLRELLMMAAFAVSMVGLLRGESLSLARFNRQDVALALIALSLVAGLFIDHAAVQHFVQQAQATAQGAASHGAAAAHGGAASANAG